MLMFVECMLENHEEQVELVICGVSWCNWINCVWYMMLYDCMMLHECMTLYLHAHHMCIHIHVYDGSIVVYALVHRLNTLATFNLTSKVIDEDLMLHRLQSSLGNSLGCAIHLEICWDVFFSPQVSVSCCDGSDFERQNGASNGKAFRPTGKSSSRCTFMSLSPCRCSFFQKQKPHLPTLWQTNIAMENPSFEDV